MLVVNQATTGGLIRRLPIPECNTAVRFLPVRIAPDKSVEVWASDEKTSEDSVISRAGGRTKSGRNGLGSDTGIKTEGVKVQDGNMVNLCDTTQVVSAQLPGSA